MNTDHKNKVSPSPKSQPGPLRCFRNIATSVNPPSENELLQIQAVTRARLTLMDTKLGWPCLQTCPPRAGGGWLCACSDRYAERWGIWIPRTSICNVPRKPRGRAHSDGKPTGPPARQRKVTNWRESQHGSHFKVSLLIKYFFSLHK